MIHAAHDLRLWNGFCRHRAFFHEILFSMTLAHAPATPAETDRRLRVPVLSLVVALALALRVWGLWAQSFTMDEMTELITARHGVHAAIVTADGLPPLYNLLLQGWLKLTGTPEAARWLSVLLGMLAIPAMYQLGRRVGGERLGQLSALLLAISPIHIWYSQEVRAYPLFILTTVVALWRYEVARQSDRAADWAWYGAAAVVGLYSHYYFILLLVSLAVLEALRLGGPLNWRRWFAAHALVGVASLPLLLLLRADLNIQLTWPENPRPLDFHAVGYTGFTLLTGFTLGPSLRELHVVSGTEALREVLPWALPLGAASLVLVWGAFRWTDRRWQAWRFSLLTVLPIALCGIIAAVLDIGYRVRYVAWCAVPLLVLLALGISSGRPRWLMRAAVAVLVLIFAAAVLNRHTVGRYMNEDARGAARLLTSVTGPAEPVFVVTNYMALPIGYYLDSARSLRPISDTRAPDGIATAVETIHGTVPKGKTFWLLYSRPFDGDPQGQLRAELREVARLRLRAEVPGIELYRGIGW
jgi:4-amino-4-deoxy-L-arabinose transferase-like glycosyltransferase